MNEPNKPRDHDSVEYQAAQSCYLHYDSFRWQAGSILIAGVFVFWGFLFGASAPPLAKKVGLLGGLVSALMAIWILFAHHYRQIYLCKLHRIHELERKMGLLQHLRFIPRPPGESAYKIFGPKGHNLDLAMFAATSLGGSMIAWAQISFDFWLLLPVPIVAISVGCVLINERRILEHLRTLSSTQEIASEPSKEPNQ